MIKKEISPSKRKEKMKSPNKKFDSRVTMSVAEPLLGNQSSIFDKPNFFEQIKNAPSFASLVSKNESLMEMDPDQQKNLLELIKKDNPEKFKELCK